MSFNVVFFKDEKGFCPFLEWFSALPLRAQDKCVAKIERLKELGHFLRRPEADYLRDDIYELRIALSGVNYRILYFFHMQKAIVISHGIIKERIVPPKEIDEAMLCKKKFESNPKIYTYSEE